MLNINHSFKLSNKLLKAYITTEIPHSKESQTIHQNPFHKEHRLKLPGMGFYLFPCWFSLFPGNWAITHPLTFNTMGELSASQYLLPGAWCGMAALTQISSFLITTWNNRWGEKKQIRTNHYYVLAFISVHWLSLWCFMCAMKGQIKPHFSFLSILSLFFNYLSSYGIAATDGTLKMNSLFGNCIL